MNVVQTVAERILDSVVGDDDEKVTKENLAKIIDNLKELDDDSMDFISD